MAGVFRVWRSRLACVYLYRQQFCGSTQNRLPNRHFVGICGSCLPAHRSASAAVHTNRPQPVRVVRSLPVVAALSSVVRGMPSAFASSLPIVQNFEALAIGAAFVVVDDFPTIRTHGVRVAGCRQADVVVWASHHARP